MNCNAPSDRFRLKGQRSHLGAAHVLRDFDEYLSRVRGLTRGTRDRYCFFVRRFLERFCRTAAPDWSSLQGEDLAAFVHREASRLKRNARDAPGTAIRALLRYLSTHTLQGQPL